MPYVLSDEALHAKDGSSREHWLEHVLSLFRLSICKKTEGRMIFPKRFIQRLLLVPACRGAVDVIICRGICKMELRQLVTSRLWLLRFSEPTSFGPTRTTSPRILSAQVVKERTRVRTEMFVQLRQDVRHRLLFYHFNVCLPPSRGLSTNGTRIGPQWMKKDIVQEIEDS